ncbi:MAG: GT-D fold domain-containing glycosyltransferase [Paenibacillaceae bacterium]
MVQVHHNRSRVGNVMSKYVLLPSVVKRIKYALQHKRAFSLVRIGDGENIVLAQQTVWPLRKVLKLPWAIRSNRGHKGIALPNLRIQNQIVRSIRKATIVGILPYNDQMIQAPPYLKRKLTDQVFKYYKLQPKLTCHACVNRIMVRKLSFFRMLKGKRILIINRHPNHIKSVLEQRPYRLHITAVIPFSNYTQINRTIRKVVTLQNSFDIALISCGVSAVILAPKIASLTGKVAIDFGKAPRFVRKGH